MIHNSMRRPVSRMQAAVGLEKGTPRFRVPSLALLVSATLLCSRRCPRAYFGACRFGPAGRSAMLRAFLQQKPLSLAFRHTRVGAEFCRRRENAVSIKLIPDQKPFWARQTPSLTQDVFSGPSIPTMDC